VTSLYSTQNARKWRTEGATLRYRLLSFVDEVAVIVTMKANIAAAAICFFSVTLVAQTPSTDQSKATTSPKQSKAVPSPTIPKIAEANPEVLQLAIQDQWDRGNDMFGAKELPPPDMHGQTVQQRDEQRHAAIRKLLTDGKVQSGTDFWLSALIFQHSNKADDLMLAHVLAVTAAAKGNHNGKWLAAASLDRYLWAIGQPQIFGTNFQKGSNGKWTNEPYAKDTVSDAERAVWCVIPLQEQEKILNNIRNGKSLEPSAIRDCN
jgi:hypothetical protein